MRENYMNTEWEKDIKPTDYREIVGNQQSINEIKEWFDDGCKYPIMLSGPPGTSKSTTIQLFLKKYNYFTKIITMMDYPNIKSIKESVIKFLNFKDVLCYFSETTERKKAVVIDDFETASIHAKSLVKLLIEYSEDFAIIFISNISHHHFKDEIMKKGEMIEFSKINKKELWLWSQAVIQVKKLRITQKLMNEIIDKSNGDIRQLSIILNQAHDMIKYNKDKIPKVRKMINQLPDKYSEKGLLKSTWDCINLRIESGNERVIYSVDRILLPRMIHENIYDDLIFDKNIVIASNRITEYDLMYQMIHAPPNDDGLHKFIAHNMCISVPIALKKSKRTITISNEKLRFPKLMTIRYQTYINKGYMVKLPDCLRYNRKEVPYLGNLAKHFLSSDQDILEFMRISELNVRQMDIILKLSSMGLKKKFRITNQKQKRIRSIKKD